MQKHCGFFEIYGVFARTRGVEPVRTSGEGGQFLAILCENPLWITQIKISFVYSCHFWWKMLKQQKKKKTKPLKF